MADSERVHYGPLVSERTKTIDRAMRQVDGNREAACKLLGMTREQLATRLNTSKLLRANWVGRSDRLDDGKGQSAGLVEIEDKATKAKREAIYASLLAEIESIQVRLRQGGNKDPETGKITPFHYDDKGSPVEEKMLRDSMSDLLENIRKLRDTDHRTLVLRIKAHQMVQGQAQGKHPDAKAPGKRLGFKLKSQMEAASGQEPEPLEESAEQPGEAPTEEEPKAV